MPDVTICNLNGFPLSRVTGPKIDIGGKKNFSYHEDWCEKDMQDNTFFTKLRTQVYEDIPTEEMIDQ
jgi:hypothetical protein